jgi:hypothetical protein
MSLFEKAQGHPVVMGTICFVLLGGALVGSLAYYRVTTTGRLRHKANEVVHRTSSQVRRLDTTLDAAREELKRHGASLSPEDRIKVNQAIVIVDENMRIYSSLLSNACSSIQQNDFEFFRLAFDPVQQSNTLQALSRDRQLLEQAIRYCRTRAGSGNPPARP